MKYSFDGRFCCILIFLLSCALGMQAETIPAGAIPVADFFKPALMEQPRLNRTGTHLIALATDKDDHKVAILYDLATGEKQLVRGGGDREIYEAVWLDDTHALLLQSDGKKYVDGMFVVDVNNKRSTYVVERNSVAFLLGVPKAHPLRPILWIFRDAYLNGEDTGPVKIEAAKPLEDTLGGTGFAGSGVGTLEVSAKVVQNYPTLPESPASGYLTGADGELKAAVTSMTKGSTLYVLNGESWLKSPIDLEKYRLIAMGDEPNEIVASAVVHGDKPGAIVRLNVLSGDEMGTLYQDNEYDCGHAQVVRHRGTGRIVGFEVVRKVPSTVWLDEGFAALQAKIEKLLPGQLVLIESFDEALTKIVVCGFSDVSPYAYYLVDLTKGRIDRLASSAPWIDPSRMCPTQVLNYKARDGVTTSGFLTLPPGTSKQNPMPLVVLPHGGPWVRDSWGWDEEAQFFASRGYAVFQPNYRGSLGTQWRYPVTDQWEFEKMSSDVTDGVKKLAASGLIDAKRIAIVGSSFGGYLAVSGACDEPDLYRCAVTVAGVFDWALMIRSAEHSVSASPLQSIYLLHGLGDPKTREDRFSRINPLNRIDRVKIPVFVAHGVGDEVVNINQSKRLVAELKKRGLAHEVMFKRGEGHGMAQLDNRVELYTAIESFLARNMQPVAPAVTKP